MKKAKFYVPTVVAFHENGELDMEGNAAIAEYLIAGGVDGLLVLGSTGEFYSMTFAQKKELILATMKTVNHRVKVFFGTNCMRKDDTVELSNFALENGADGVMIIGPYYFAVDQDDLIRYYDDLCEAINGPVYLYNYPERTGYDFPVSIIPGLLRKHPNIRGMKDSHSQYAHTRQILEATREEYPYFEVYSGYDENLAHVLLSGGDGCIGGLGNIYPEICSGFVKALNERNLDQIEKYQKIMNRMSEFYTYGTPFIPLCKKAMIEKGVQMEPYCLHPVTEPDETQNQKIRDYLCMIDEMKKSL